MKSLLNHTVLSLERRYSERSCLPYCSYSFNDSLMNPLLLSFLCTFCLYLLLIMSGCPEPLSHHIISFQLFLSLLLILSLSPVLFHTPHFYHPFSLLFIVTHSPFSLQALSFANYNQLSITCNCAIYKACSIR